MKKVTIKHLHEVPQHFNTIAEWIFNQWWNKPGNTIEVVKEPLREHLQAKKFPAALVAFANDAAPIGSVLLIESDGISELPELTPWLAALYVVPQYRGQGIGQQLVQAMEQYAMQLGFKQLYLVATDRVGFYQNLDWHVHTKLVGSTGITIMRKDVRTTCATNS